MSLTGPQRAQATRHPHPDGAYPRTGHVPSEPKLLLDVMVRILAWMELYLA